MDEKYIYNRITDLRMQKNVSERQMSLDLGHSPSYINGLASGKLPSVPELFYICDYLEISVSDFFLEETNPSLSQAKAIQYIYKMNDEDVMLILSFIERIMRKKT